MRDLPRVRLLHLREYRSASDEPYFLGWWGDAKVIMRRDPRAPRTGREVARWSVEVEQREPAPFGAEQKAAPSQPAPQPSTSRSSPPARRASPNTTRTPPRANKREEAAASDVLRRHGIDPASPIREDEVPW